MTFNEVYRTILLRESHGTVKAREEEAKEVWNCALDAACDIITENCEEIDYTLRKVRELKA